MTRAKIELLQEELAGLKLAAGHLDYSVARCLSLIDQKDLLPYRAEKRGWANAADPYSRIAELNCA